ncbi:hypothetical protein Tco_0313974 [Tanacetum coccineum]
MKKKKQKERGGRREKGTQEKVKYREREESREGKLRIWASRMMAVAGNTLIEHLVRRLTQTVRLTQDMRDRAHHAHMGSRLVVMGYHRMWVHVDGSGRREDGSGGVGVGEEDVMAWGGGWWWWWWWWLGGGEGEEYGDEREYEMGVKDEKFRR